MECKGAFCVRHRARIITHSVSCAEIQPVTRDPFFDVTGRVPQNPHQFNIRTIQTAEFPRLRSLCSAKCTAQQQLQLIIDLLRLALAEEPDLCHKNLRLAEFLSREIIRLRAAYLSPSHWLAVSGE